MKYLRAFWTGFTVSVIFAVALAVLIAVCYVVASSPVLSCIAAGLFVIICIYAIGCGWKNV